MLSNKDIEYMNYTLGDIGVIELLLSYRYKYDDYYEARQQTSFMVVDGVLPMNEEMILTYASLDKYIEDCNFSEIQLAMLRMIEKGYVYEEIADTLGLRLSVISGRYKTIYKKIVKQNERQWRKSVYFSNLELKGKQCSKCKEELPATSEFFSDLNRTKDGFHSQCRECKG